MGRKPKENTKAYKLNQVSEKILNGLVTEENPSNLIDLLKALKELEPLIHRPTVITKLEAMKANAEYVARKLYPIAQECEVEGCEELGIRHHDDYTKPEEIKWLCPKHHSERHRLFRGEDENDEAIDGN